MKTKDIRTSLYKYIQSIIWKLKYNFLKLIQEVKILNTTVFAKKKKNQQKKMSSSDCFTSNFHQAFKEEKYQSSINSFRNERRKEEAAQISFMRLVSMIMTPKCEGHYKKKN